MENRRIPKNRYNRSGAVPNSRHTKLKSAFDAEQDELKKIEMAMDKHAADIALTISDMFKFMLMAASTLPNMELHTELLNLTVDDSGISVYIKHPDNNGEDDDYDDEEEELLYDGD